MNEEAQEWMEKDYERNREAYERMAEVEVSEDDEEIDGWLKEGGLDE